MKSTKLFSMLIGALMLMTAVNAHALTSYSSSAVLGTTPVSLSSAANDYAVFSFAKANGVFTEATLTLDVFSVTNALIKIGTKFLSAPPTGTLITDAAGDYLADISFSHTGLQTIDLTPYLASLNAANSATGIDLGLGVTRGAISLSGAKLTGTVAPEPVSMALVGAGLCALPFARRFRKYLKS
jgi:roadblock/LC7 domain-containing protein